MAHFGMMLGMMCQTLQGTHHLFSRVSKQFTVLLVRVDMYGRVFLHVMYASGVQADYRSHLNETQMI